MCQKEIPVAMLKTRVFRKSFRPILVASAKMQLLGLGEGIERRLCAPIKMRPRQVSRALNAAPRSTKRPARAQYF